VAKLANFVGKIILICIPGLTKDDRPYPYKLVDIEVQGLWLESRTLSHHVKTEHPGQEIGEFVAFVPFSQILYVLSDAVIDPDTSRRVRINRQPESSSDAEPPPGPQRNRKPNHKR
jgi:hypothetical protein